MEVMVRRVLLGNVGIPRYFRASEIPHCSRNLRKYIPTSIQAGFISDSVFLSSSNVKLGRCL